MITDTLIVLKAQRAEAERNIADYDRNIQRTGREDYVDERRFWAQRAYQLDAQIKELEEQLCH